MKEERELYKATKAISTQNNAQRKINAQNQLSSSSFVNRMKNINKAFPHIRSKEDKNYMKENFMKIQEKVSLQKKILELKEEEKNKKPFKMKKFENVVSKVARNLQKTGEGSLGVSKATQPKRVITEECAPGQVEEEEQGEYDNGEEAYGEGEGEEVVDYDDEEVEYVEEEVDYDDEVEYVEEEVEYEEEEVEYEEEEVEYEEEEVEYAKEVEYEDDETGYEEVSRKCQIEKRQDTAAEADSVSAPAKRESSIIEKLSKRGSELPSTEKGNRKNLHKNFGKLPTYILKKKKDIVDDSTDVPDGYRLLKNDERSCVLKELHSQLTETTEEYKINKDKTRKIELGKRLKEIKESIELLSKPHVLVNENF
ncbi:conserved Plasmodium protein, unknown function [Plasmodium knowlesi strain H]|uniref:Enkurin domain-containing protein n=3 Tax=Plasmodium knowlesi TaxID=5850 RepID=A0A5K1TUM7_PLAKH|nr:conserved Plasmodium protein, unknown function [Plasmodium knowlesi strain H]OTN67519.1 Uncharacterized protein PKNOH_S06428400 [Plasmodium knowlesi]CAA9987555.1 conserved Plasmodium protein, unknown function [Plasmodium knowlesi strain H]SBO23066.1 conserved Plasmodium protein, unknown function [Plasmodium knowlesi strain H]SBO23729.1 conserved Plasmodium protein, unknown function [Plasmodium knowlesi strain H]VVS77029.1 conserved Plasmodium protein, unknown function [Plasmodium knowlesi s|eukprot:XP_002258557.1 hypothetical protein, conserved in Plasmodium species [Plasmodium knowlesi strain H]